MIKDLDIQPDIPVADVFFIQPYYFFEICDITATAHLPHAGDARFDCQADSVVQLIEIGFGNQRRPCA